MVKSASKYFKGSNDSVALDFITSSNFAQIARAFGIEGITCCKKDGVRDCIDEFLRAKGPVLLDCITVNTDCYPHVPFGKGLNQMLVQEKN